MGTHAYRTFLYAQPWRYQLQFTCSWSSEFKQILVSRSGLFVVDKVSNWPTVEARQVGKSFSSQSCSPRKVSSPHCRPTIRPCRVVYKVPCRKSSSAIQVGWLPAQKSLFRLCFMRHVGLFYSTLASTGDGTQVSSGRRNRLVNILFMTFVNMTSFDNF